MTSIKITGIEDIEQKPTNDIEYISLETLVLPTQQYGKSNETIDSGIGIRNIETSLEKYCGDWSDGDVTIAGTTTLTKDMYYNNLTVSGTLNITGYRVFVKNLCQVLEGGVIQANGNNGSNGTVGQSGVAPQTGTNNGVGGDGGAGGTATPSGTIYGTLAGVAGGKGSNGSTSAIPPVFTGTGGVHASVGGLPANNGTAQTSCINSLSGNAGGTGGYSGAGPGQPGGTGGTVTQAKEKPTDPFGAKYLITFDGTNIVLLRSGGVGGGGGPGLGGTGGASGLSKNGGGGGGGGGSGASGGIVLLRAKQIINNGTIQANGGNGGNGGDGGNQTESFEGGAGGGGAGGNGGVVILVCKVYQGIGVTQANGGTGGTKGANTLYSAASNGADGAVGTVITITL